MHKGCIRHVLGAHEVSTKIAAGVQQGARRGAQGCCKGPLKEHQGYASAAINQSINQIGCGSDRRHHLKGDSW